MRIHKTNEIELYEYTFLVRTRENQTVEVTFRDSIGFVDVVFNNVFVKRLDIKKQGQIILNNGVGVKDQGKLKTFHHIEKVDYKGSEVYNKETVVEESRNLLEDLFGFDFYEENVKLKVKAKLTIVETPVGEFVNNN